MGIYKCAVMVFVVSFLGQSNVVEFSVMLFDVDFISTISLYK